MLFPSPLIGDAGLVARNLWLDKTLRASFFMYDSMVGRAWAPARVAGPTDRSTNLRTVRRHLLGRRCGDNITQSVESVMNSHFQNPPTNIVTIIGGVAKTTSLIVAEKFGKQHRDVLRAIRNLECSPEFSLRNFAQCQRINELANGKPEPFFEMTRDGFTFLAMGFTGKEAAKWKEAYIDAFNQMEAELFNSAKTDALPKSKKALPGGLTLEQQDAIKALVRSRVDVLPKDKQGKAAITCWSSIKSKFQVKTYKEVPPEQFGEVLSLVARLPLEGEHIPAGQPEPALPQSAPVWEGRVLLTFRNGVPVAARALDEDEITLRRRELAGLWQGVIQDNMAAAARMALFCEAHSVSLPTAKA
jgi:Rha family phage regulatory protein